MFHTVGEGDMNGLVMKVSPRFTLNDIAVMPVGAHILMLHIDPETGRTVGIEGFEVEEEWINAALEAHANDERDVPFSSVLFQVNPVTDEEASQIADRVIASRGIGKPKDELGDRTLASLHAMLMEAAKLGRGLDG